MGTQKYSVSYIMFLALLAALGSVLMLVEIPYPFAGYLTFDLSEIVVLFVLIAFGLKPAFLVAGLKSLLHLLLKGPAGYYAIGQITAFLASVTIALAYNFFVKKLTKEDQENDTYKFVYGNVMTGIIFTAVMVIANYLFITPIYSGVLFFTQLEFWNTSEYLVSILTLFVPFNLIKISMVLIVFATVKDYLLKAFNTYYKG